MFSFRRLNLPEDFPDLIKLVLLKIAPRLLLALLLSLLFSAIDNYVSINEMIAFLILFSFLIFYYLPPSIDTIYVLKKTGNKEADEITFLRLIKISKDSDSGIFTLEGSLVIKSSYDKAVKYYERLKERYSFEGYEVLRQEKSKRGFNEDYYKLLESVSWKWLEGATKSEVEIYHLDNIGAVNL